MKNKNVSLFISLEYQFSTPWERLASWLLNQYLNCLVRMMVSIPINSMKTIQTLAVSKCSLQAQPPLPY